MIIFLGLQTTVALAANETGTVSIETARNVAAEFDYCLEKNKSNEKIIFLLKDKGNNLYNLSEAYKEKLTLMEQDKEIYKVRGDKFEEEFSNCSDQLAETIKEKPSRLTWFGAGVVSTLVGILMIALVAK